MRGDYIALYAEFTTKFKDSSLAQQHTIVNEVFKRGFTFKDGAFRTFWITPEFKSNLLIIKEKRLLFLEQPFGFPLDFPSGRVAGSPLEHLEVILAIIREVYTKK